MAENQNNFKEESENILEFLTACCSGVFEDGDPCDYQYLCMEFPDNKSAADQFADAIIRLGLSATVHKDTKKGNEAYNWYYVQLDKGNYTPERDVTYLHGRVMEKLTDGKFEQSA